MINLIQTVEVIDADGTPIKNKEGTCPTLKEILLYAFRAIHPSDQQQGFKEKNERYLIVKRIEKVDEIELNEAEIKICKERIGKIYVQAGIVGRASELLSGEC